MNAQDAQDLRNQAYNTLAAAKKLDIAAGSQNAPEARETLQRALELYMDAASVLLKSDKYSRTEEEHARIKGMAGHWIMRAEQLKEELSKPATKRNVGQVNTVTQVNTGVGAEIESIVMNMIQPLPSAPPRPIRGMDDIKRRLIDLIVYPFKHADYLREFEASSGILLIGVPGCGKTTLVKEVVSKLKDVSDKGVTFMTLKAKDSKDKYVGVAEKLIDEMFKVAKARAPTVIFIDELDAIIPARSSSDSQQHNAVVATFLTCMSDTDPDKFVMVIGATNHPDRIDDAALRRLANKEFIPMPNDVARHDIIVDCLPSGEGKARHVLTDEDIATLVEHTKGFSGDDIQNLIKDAAKLPLNRTDDAKRFKMRDDGLYEICSCEECEGTTKPECEHCGSIATTFGALTAQKVVYEPITFDDVLHALARRLPSVTAKALQDIEKYKPTTPS